MSGDEFEDPPEERFPALTALFERYPLAYAGYRISHLLRHDRDISESDEIPFVTNPIFPIAIVGYLVLSRVRGLLDGSLGDGPVGPGPASGPVDHVFSMTSTQGYRTHTFLEVAATLSEAGEDVVFLCSPAAADRREEWEREGYDTVTHRELHRGVSILALLRDIVAAVVQTAALVRTADVERGIGNYVLYYNFVLLEHVKRESVRPLTAGDPLVHTYSPMPYLVDAAGTERLFVYQHGIQQNIGGKIMAAPFCFPLTYLVWGEPWKRNFERFVHSDSEIVTVGSPWYEYLADQRDSDRSPTHDVLLVSDSHGLTDEVEPAFEEMVEAVLDVCERGERSLAVKLHPLEDADWYERRGWGEYVVDYDDIDDALLDARVAVVNTSTAFVESAVLGVPVVVADLWERGLSELAPVDLVRFTDGPAVGEAVEAGLTDPDSFSNPDSAPLVVLGDATVRIRELTEQRRDELEER
ncbi:MAG: hypothetical protein ABEJ26_05660 [Halosimplex sp.]